MGGRSGSPPRRVGDTKALAAPPPAAENESRTGVVGLRSPISDCERDRDDAAATGDFAAEAGDGDDVATSALDTARFRGRGAKEGGDDEDEDDGTEEAERDNFEAELGSGAARDAGRSKAVAAAGVFDRTIWEAGGGGGDSTLIARATRTSVRTRNESSTAGSSAPNPNPPPTPMSTMTRSAATTASCRRTRGSDGAAAGEPERAVTEPRAALRFAVAFANSGK
jgi:hypothetical protein